ncbi:hypothetical protein niasHT_022533 [Heterodera trifolii]|uniref:Uncharacterized protein n=1 Tax=Heterodera trifolii TaxID=157864 RepID=A0ABD2JRM9_9BILA
MADSVDGDDDHQRRREQRWMTDVNGTLQSDGSFRVFILEHIPSLPPKVNSQTDGRTTSPFHPTSTAKHNTHIQPPNALHLRGTTNKNGRMNWEREQPLKGGRQRKRQRDIERESRRVIGEQRHSPRKERKNENG